MKIFPAFLLGLGILASSGSEFPSAFSYQGKLLQAGNPANGRFDFTFQLFEAATGGIPASVSLTNNIQVSNGVFSVPLNFGQNTIGAKTYWLEIRVKTNGAGVFNLLSPRQVLLPSPQALYAGSASNALTAQQVPWNGVAGLPSGFADGVDNDTTYLPGAGLVLWGSHFGVDFAGNGTMEKVSRSDHSHAWNQITGIPGGFADGVDNDATYQPGAGLVLQGNHFGVNFAGSGTANTVARSDHSHPGSGGGIGNTTGGITTTIAGGVENTIQNNSGSSSIGGGYRNFVSTGSSFSVIGGGVENYIAPDAFWSTISGGSDNSVSSTVSTIGGGYSNIIFNAASWATIGGGVDNWISPGGYNSTISGGYQNWIRADSSTIGGGRLNVIESNATWSVIGGGVNNLIGFNASSATIPGGYENRVDGSFSLAAGYRAQALHHGSFVWNDFSGTNSFRTTAPNQFLVRAAGGTWFASTRDINIGVGLAPGGNSWSAFSDRNGKEHIRQVNEIDILEKLCGIEISNWNLISQSPSVRHLGPMAQDFYAAFGLGESERYINSSDAHGVAFAAIQGLNQKSQEKERRIQALEDEVTELKRLVQELLQQRERP